jgi:hypothetical protein
MIPSYTTNPNVECNKNARSGLRVIVEVPLLGLVEVEERVNVSDGHDMPSCLMPGRRCRLTSL